MSSDMRKLLRIVAYSLTGWAISYGLLAAAKTYLSYAPPCARACDLPASTWTGDSMDATEPTCQPLTLTVDIAEPRFSTKDIAPLWYRVTARNDSCGVLEAFPLTLFRNAPHTFWAHVFHPNKRFQLRQLIVDSNGQPATSIVRSLHTPDQPPFLTLLFATDEDPPSKHPEIISLAPGEAVMTAREKFKPRRYSQDSHGFSIEPLVRKYTNPREHPGYAAFDYNQFTKPGRYFLVAELDAQVRVRRMFPRFAALPEPLKRACYLLNRIKPLLPAPVPDFDQNHGRSIAIRARSKPVAFEVLP